MSPSATIPIQHAAFEGPPRPLEHDPGTQWSQVTLLTDHWPDRALRRIAELAMMRENWDGYGSPAPDTDVLRNAITLIKAIDIGGFGSFLPAPTLVPTMNGGIQLEWRVQTRELELELVLDGPPEYLKSAHGEPFEESVVSTPATLGALLSWLVGSEGRATS